MLDEARESHSSIQRLSEFLGMSPGEVIEPARQGLAGKCVSFEEILEYQRSGQIPPRVDTHLRQCSACASLSAAMAPDAERLQRFQQERERLEREQLATVHPEPGQSRLAKIFAWA